ncbi:MAG: FAD:protein FMN transferase [Lachnotalea sp.]
MEKSFYAFGTMNHMKIESNISEEVLNQMVEHAYDLDDLMSMFKPTSEISNINQNAGIKPVKVSKTVITVLDRALHFSKISEGAFDITIRPAVKLWGIGHKEEQIPTESELAKVKPLVDYRLLSIDKKTNQVFLKKKGQSIDLGGIAKGYAADIIQKKLLEAGVESGILNFGGTIITIGKKPNGSPWRVGIQNPLDKRGKSVGSIELNDAALVTSAVNERFFIKEGITYHHILDTQSLKPAQSGVLGVSAVGASGMELDALTTALFVMGMDRGINFVNSLGVEVLYLLNNGQMYATKGFTGEKLNFKANFENKKGNDIK